MWVIPVITIVMYVCAFGDDIKRDIQKLTTTEQTEQTQEKK